MKRNQATFVIAWTGHFSHIPLNITNQWFFNSFLLMIGFLYFTIKLRTKFCFEYFLNLYFVSFYSWKNGQQRVSKLSKRNENCHLSFSIRMEMKIETMLCFEADSVPIQYTHKRIACIQLNSQKKRTDKNKFNWYQRHEGITYSFDISIENVYNCCIVRTTNCESITSFFVVLVRSDKNNEYFG